MPKFIYIVTIECDEMRDAERVIGERLGFDENYGFNYTLDFEHASCANPDFDIRGSMQVQLSEVR